MKKPNTHGGKRIGSGRKNKLGDSKTMRVPIDIIDKVIEIIEQYIRDKKT